MGCTFDSIESYVYSSLLGKRIEDLRVNTINCCQFDECKLYVSLECALDDVKMC